MRRGLGLTGAAIAALLVLGGYVAHWSWTGINGHTATLWDWLHLLALPLAAVVLALCLRHRPTLGPRAWLAVALAGAGFVALVAAGYLIPWAWTGFTGNTLWDWLNLAMLPLAVVLIPVMLELRDAWEARHRTAAVGGLAVFAALVAAGYLIPWAWTGFTGNTAWDWLHLLLLPLLVPLVIIPVIRSLTLARMGVEPLPSPAPTGAGGDDRGQAGAEAPNRQMPEAGQEPEPA